MMMTQLLHGHFTIREHREIFQLANTPANAPQNAPNNAPQAAPNVPANNPNAAKKNAQDRILKAEAAGKKVRDMKAGIDASLNAIKGLNAQNNAPAANPMKDAAQSIDALKQVSNIDQIPADDLNTMMTEVRALGPDAAVVCDAITDAMQTLDAAAVAEADPVKKQEIADMKIMLENNSKLVLADLLTPDVKSNAPGGDLLKSGGIFSFMSEMDPVKVKEIEDAANADPLMQKINDATTTETNRNTTIGKLMSKFGVTVEQDAAGKYIAIAPASPLVKFLNQITGLFVTLGLGKKLEIKSAKTVNTAGNAPANGPQTALTQTEQDALKKNIKDPAIGMTREKADATARRKVAEDLLNGTPANPVGLNQKIINLTTEQATLQAEIQNLKNQITNNPAMPAADKTAKENDINTKTTRLNAIPAELKTAQEDKQKQEDVVKKENEKIKYMDDMKSVADKNKTDIEETFQDLTAFTEHADIATIVDAASGVLSDPDDRLQITYEAVLPADWQKFEDLAVRSGLQRSTLAIDQTTHAIKSPDEFLATLKTIKQKLVDRGNDIDARFATFTAGGAKPEDAKIAAKMDKDFQLNMTCTGGVFTLGNPPFNKVIEAYESGDENDVTTKVLADYMVANLDPSDPKNDANVKAILSKANGALAVWANPAVQDQLLTLAKQMPKGDVTISIDRTKTDWIEPAVTTKRETAQNTALYKSGTLNADLKSSIDLS